MKFIHISDLHLGKRVNEFSMLEEQKYILQQVLDTVQNEAVDAVLIAGDIYDKPVPPAEAVVLFDTFLTRLSQMKKEVFIISGNHDSAARRGLHAAGLVPDPAGRTPHPGAGGLRQPRQRRAALIWKQSVYGGGDSYCAGI